MTVPDNAVDYTKDVCDFCSRVYDVGSGHVCATMPIERLIEVEKYGPSYDTLVSCFGEIVVAVADNDYQGDTRYLVRGADGRWGVVIVGWGSCSGCDALQACSKPKDYAELRDSIGAGATWFDTAAACATYLTDKDWEASYLREAETRDFVEQCLAALAPPENTEGKP
jgi:hypothetical protein